ncbi:helix-turn-helix domain-containing protein [Candidatus Latescibacterota bacterium]
MKGWLRLKEAQEYCGVSERTLHTWLKERGLKHSRIGSIVSIKVDWIDEFMEQYERVNNTEEVVNSIVNDVIESMPK